MRLITDVVAPESWQDNGGTLGSMHQLRSKLVVKQSPENHAAVKKLLEKLGLHADDFGPIVVTHDDESADAITTAVYSIPASIVPFDRRTRQERVDAITRLITSVVAPDTWRDAGGTIGQIRELQGQLIITQTRRNLAAIRALIMKLSVDGG
jgi:uncharacterized protein YggL (DUF469 family)